MSLALVKMDTTEGRLLGCDIIFTSKENQNKVSDLVSVLTNILDQNKVGENLLKTLPFSLSCFVVKN